MVNPRTVPTDHRVAQNFSTYDYVRLKSLLRRQICPTDCQSEIDSFEELT